MDGILSIKQMQHLNKLGLELGETMCYWARLIDYNPKSQEHYGKWILVIGNNQQHVGLTGWEFVPAYTLQDTLEKLPKSIELGNYELNLNIYYHKGGISVFYDNGNIMHPTVFCESTLLKSAYKMLCWCIEQGFIKTGKEK
jgi:hypothetical protein